MAIILANIIFMTNIIVILKIKKAETSTISPPKDLTANVTDCAKIVYICQEVVAAKIAPFCRIKLLGFVLSASHWISN